MKRAKSIAILGTRGYPSYYGGFETLVRRLAPYLVAEGWDVTVYGRRGLSRPEDPDRSPAVRCVETRGFESKRLSTLSFGLTSALDARRKRPDVALVMNVANGFWLPLLRNHDIPSVVNVDGIEWERQKWGGSAKRVFLAGARLTARYANTLIFDSRNIAERWQSEFSRAGEFIPYGGQPFETTELPVGLTHRGYILFVARFVPENTVVEFFQAAHSLAQRWPVILVGSSGYGGALDAVARRLSINPNVRWLGHLTDDRLLFSLWHHAGVYFHGHSVGGTNPALVQAMACGAPLVARDTIYNREVLEDTAKFTDPDPASITAAVQEILEDPERQEQMATAGRSRAAERYSWESVCSRYLEVIEEARGRNQVARKRSHGDGGAVTW